MTTEEQQLEMVRRYVAGESQKEIARAFNVSQAGVSWLFKKRGVRARVGGGFKKKNFTEEQQVSICDAYMKGEGLMPLSKRYKCHFNRIVRTLLAGGVKTRSSGEQSRIRKRTGSEVHNWTGIGEISGKVFSGYVRHARDRGLDFSLSKENLWNLFLSQNRQCKYLKEILLFGAKPTASLDRIDSTKGYVEGNVQWVHKVVNQMKWNLPESRFIALCNKISENSKE